MVFHTPSTDIILLWHKVGAACVSLTAGLCERKCAKYMANVGPFSSIQDKEQSHGFIRLGSLNLSELSK